MIRLRILTANATYSDGETAQLSVSSEVIRVILKPHIRIESESSITVFIDLQPENLETIGISHSLNLGPVIKAAVDG